MSGARWKAPWILRMNMLMFDLCSEVFGTWLGWSLLSYYAMFHFAAKKHYRYSCHLHISRKNTWHELLCVRPSSRLDCCASTRLGKMSVARLTTTWTSGLAWQAGEQSASVVFSNCFKSTFKSAGAACPILLWHAGEFEGFAWFGAEDQQRPG